MAILRGPYLNQYEGQCFEKLPKFGFQPIGIATYDNLVDLSQIHFPVRLGHNFKTYTKGTMRPLLSVASKLTRYNFRSWNLQVYNLKELLRGIDFIHSADVWFPFTYQAVKTGLPTIVTEWENIPFNVENLPYSKYKKYNRVHVTHFVAVTEKAKEALLAEGVNADKITVIPAGLDCEVFKPAPKNPQLSKQLGISENSIRILFVGRLVPEKGIFTLLNAFSQLQSTAQNVELLVVGSGTKRMKAQVKRLVADLKIEGKVKFTRRLQIQRHAPNPQFSRHILPSKHRH